MKALHQWFDDILQEVLRRGRDIERACDDIIERPESAPVRMRDQPVAAYGEAAMPFMGP